MIDIPEGSSRYVGRSLVTAVGSGMTPYRCSRCCYNRCKIERCFKMACSAQEREDRRNVYFVKYETERSNDRSGT